MAGRSKINVKQVHYKDKAGFICYIYALELSRVELTAELLGAQTTEDWRYLVCDGLMYHWEGKPQMWKRSSLEVLDVTPIAPYETEFVKDRQIRAGKTNALG